MSTINKIVKQKFFILLTFLLFSCNPFSDTEEVSYIDSQGKVKVTGTQVNGKKDGVWSYYNAENGQLFRECEYKANALHGVCKEHVDGKLVSEKHYEWGASHGPSIQYNADNGKPYVKGQFEKGKMVGIWYFYNSEGALTKKWWYENDQLVKTEDIVTKKVQTF